MVDAKPDLGSRKTDIGVRFSYLSTDNSQKLFARSEISSSRSSNRVAQFRYRFLPPKEIKRRSSHRLVEIYSRISGGLRFARQQLAFNYSKLSVNHSKQIRLTTMSEGKVLRSVRE